MESSVDVVCQAIHVFYSAGENSREAQQYLQAFQESPESWTICDQIIGRHTDSLACCFAAQTLRTKIAKKFKQLPVESYESLRQSLINHLNRHGASAQDQQTEATSTQLCLAIADLYIQVYSWNNWIIELLNQCQSLEGDRTIMTLTLLQVFPEEVEQLQGIGENRRNAIREELANCEGPMLSFLSHALSKFHNNFDLLRRVLKCLEANLLNEAMGTNLFAESPLISTIFQILSSDHEVPSTLHEAATNVVVAALYRVENVEKHEKLAKILQCGIVQLAGAFKQAEAREDFDRLQNLSRIFVELCESFYYQIVSVADPNPTTIGSLACLELLLLISEHHDYSLIEMTFNVWYRITEELFKYDDSYSEKFRTYTEKFIICIYEHCKLDPDNVNDMIDEKSEFGEFRLKAVEALRDVVFIVSTKSCIETMYEKLEECSRRPNASWEESEAALFVMASVAHNLLPEVDGKMKEVLSSVVSLPTNSPPALITTSLSLIGEILEWLEKRTELLEPLLKWVLQFALDPRFSLEVSECLEKISFLFSGKMVHLLEDLLKLITTFENSTENGLKMEKAINSIIKTCSLIITNLDENEAKIGMERLCEPILRNLNQTIELASNDGSPPVNQATTTNNNNNGLIGRRMNENNKENDATEAKLNESWQSISNRPIIWIDRVACVFKDVWKPKEFHRKSPNHPILWIEVAKEFYEALLKATRKFQSTTRLVEHSIRSIRVLSRALGPHSIIFVEPIVQTIMEIYPKHHHSCFLYIASVIVDEFGGLDTMRPGLLKMLEILSTVTFEIFAKTNGCVFHPDIVDDLFRLAERFTSRATSSFFVHPVSTLLFSCAIANLSIEHREANRSITRFIVEVIEQLLKAKKVNYSDAGVIAAQNLMVTQGANLVSAVVIAAVFHVSSSLRSDMAEILVLIGKLNETKLHEWLLEACNSLPNEPMKATKEQLNHFVEQVLKQRTSFEIEVQFKELIRLFS